MTLFKKHRRFWQNIKLGIWASEQRTHFRGQGRGAKKRLPASLHSEKVEMLTDLDFPWKIEEVPHLPAGPCGRATGAYPSNASDFLSLFDSTFA